MEHFLKINNRKGLKEFASKNGNLKKTAEILKKNNKTDKEAEKLRVVGINT